MIGAGVLLVGVSFVGTSSFVFVDEAALLAQIELHHQGEWVTPTPLAEIDTDEPLVPMIRSEITDEGYAPYVKHPVYVEVTARVHDLGGLVALRLFVSATVLVAACGSWALASSRGPRVALLAFWITLVASPLLFDAQLLIAHGPAAALAAWLFVVLSRCRGLALWGSTLLIVVLGSLLRSEFVLLGLAIAVVLGARWLKFRLRDDLVTALGAAGGAMGTYLFEPRLTQALVGESGGASGSQPLGPQVVSSASQQGVDEFLDAVTRTMIGTSTRAHDLPSTELVLMVFLLGAVALVLLRLRPDPRLAVVPAALALAAATVLLFGPTVAAGLLVGFPMVTVLLLRAPKGDVARQERWLPWVVAIFGCAVLVTQYSDGGGFEWGWRYFAIAVPALSPVLASRLVRAWDVAEAPGRFALSFVVVAFAMVPVGGLREAQRLVSGMEDLQHRVDEVLAPADVDYYVTVSPPFGRFAYELSLGGRLVLVDEAAAPDLLDELDAREVERLMLIWRTTADNPVRDLSGYEPAGPAFDIESRFRGQELRRS